MTILHNIGNECYYQRQMKTWQESSETEKEVDPFYIFEVLINIGQSAAKTNFFVLSNPEAHGVRT